MTIATKANVVQQQHHLEAEQRPYAWFFFDKVPVQNTQQYEVQEPLGDYPGF